MRRLIEHYNTPPIGPLGELGTALASVLRDAEPSAWCNLDRYEWYQAQCTLAALADRLREMDPKGIT